MTLVEVAKEAKIENKIMFLNFIFLRILKAK